MQIIISLEDPRPSAERGTLEYAASGMLRTLRVSVAMTEDEARRLCEDLHSDYPYRVGSQLAELRDRLAQILPPR